VDGLNEALLAKAAEAKLLRTSRVRADTTVVPANVAYPTDSGLLGKAIRRIAATSKGIRAAGGATRTKLRDRSRAAGRRRGRLARAVNELTGLLDATREIVAQTRQRVAGITPDGATRRVSLRDGDARPIAKGRLGRPVRVVQADPLPPQRRRHCSIGRVRPRREG
jgi:transposase, IS5 family